jgi:hypothetical protein
MCNGRVELIILKATFMKKYSLVPLLVLLMSLSSCEVIGGIFKAGVWSGVILVVVIVGLVLFLISRLFGGGRK